MLRELGRVHSSFLIRRTDKQIKAHRSWKATVTGWRNGHGLQAGCGKDRPSQPEGASASSSRAPVSV